jgi:hypothetical protein
MEYPFTAAHIAARLHFSQQHQGWSDDRWIRVLFGDETYICLGAQGRVWVQRPIDTAYDSQHMVQGQSNFPEKIGIWACFSSQGVGGLRIFDGNMNTREYTDTMQKFLLPSFKRFYPNQEWKYIQDNATYHKSKGSHTWFHGKSITLIKIPPHSPDLNPIENLWADLKRRIQFRFPRNIAQLKACVKEEWECTPSLTCSNLVDSMHGRMLAVIEAEGHMTRY